jgi:hypothetical protein
VCALRDAHLREVRVVVKVSGRKPRLAHAVRRDVEGREGRQRHFCVVADGDVPLAANGHGPRNPLWMPPRFHPHLRALVPAFGGEHGGCRSDDEHTERSDD